MGSLDTCLSKPCLRRWENLGHENHQNFRVQGLAMQGTNCHANFWSAPPSPPPPPHGQISQFPRHSAYVLVCKIRESAWLNCMGKLTSKAAYIWPWLAGGQHGVKPLLGYAGPVRDRRYRADPDAGMPMPDEHSWQMVKMRTNFFPGIAAFRHFKAAETIAWFPHSFSAGKTSKTNFHGMPTRK